MCLVKKPSQEGHITVTGTDMRTTMFGTYWVVFLVQVRGWFFGVHSSSFLTKYQHFLKQEYMAFFVLCKQCLFCACTCGILNNNKFFLQQKKKGTHKT